jgi:hypothetical protein
MDGQNIITTTTAEPIIEEHPFVPGDITAVSLLQMVGNGVKKLSSKPAVVLWSSLLLLALWGVKGNPALIFPETWRKALFPYLAWRDQLVSYLVGFILVAVIPCCIIKFYFKESLAKYGLGWSKDKIKPGLIIMLVLLVLSLPLFYSGSLNKELQKEYPLFGTFAKGHPQEGQFKIQTWGGFIFYELIYFLFFINIEFIFRGYLLFGLYEGTKRESPAQVSGASKPALVGGVAILIQILIYTTWHLPKPAMEYVGAFFWGGITTVIALRIRSLWPIIIAHWLLNIFLDTLLWLR